MTKVIFPDSDEKGGCRNAYPGFAEGLTGTKKGTAGKGEQQGILKRSFPWPSES